MTVDIIITKLNESYLRVKCEQDLAMELSEAFQFEVPGFRHMPAYKAGKFDGKIRIFNLGKRTLPLGLFEKLLEFCQQRDYIYQVDSVPGLVDPGSTAEISYQEVAEYVSNLDLHGGGKPVTVRDYQLNGIHTALDKKRGVLQAATGSGKSMILYSFCRYLTDVKEKRVLIIVPTISLTSQMKGDFADYSSNTTWSADENVHLITAGVTKDTSKSIVISTFQSIYKQPAEWFNSFGAIFCDEGHKINSATIAAIYEKATTVEYKLACTGTVHDTKCHILVMQGLTGPIYDIASTKKLIDNGQLVPLDIKALVLDYNATVCKAMSKVEYDDEIKFIASNLRRNSLISKLAVNAKGTTLVLYRFVDIQGKPLYNKISQLAGERPVHFINGNVKGQVREEIRSTSNQTDSIIVASFAVFAAGVNLPAIENIIFAHPFKSKITGLQSIGRGLRLKEGKVKCVLYDIADNMGHRKNINNTYRHFGERLKMYTQAGFSFNITHLDFNHE